MVDVDTCYRRSYSPNKTPKAKFGNVTSGSNVESISESHIVEISLLPNRSHIVLLLLSTPMCGANSRYQNLVSTSTAWGILAFQNLCWKLGSFYSRHIPSRSILITRSHVFSHLQSLGCSLLLQQCLDPICRSLMRGDYLAKCVFRENDWWSQAFRARELSSTRANQIIIRRCDLCCKLEF